MDANEIFATLLTPDGLSDPYPLYAALHDIGDAIATEGAGAHFCIGSALARLEAAVAFPQILDRFPELAAAGEPVRKNGLVPRGHESLPVTVT